MRSRTSWFRSCTEETLVDPRGVELVERFVEIVRAPAAHAGERRLDLVAHLAVLGEEAMRDARFLRDQRAADEKLRRLRRIDAPVVDLPPRDLEAVTSTRSSTSTRPAFALQCGSV